jgi:microcystin-dependent protein
MSRARTLADYVARNADNKAGIIAFFSATTAPDGWLECNGAAVSRTTYAALFAALGTTYGVGDGSTTFNLPDLRGEFIRGWDNGRGVDTGRSFGAGQTDAMQGHKHQTNRAVTMRAGVDGNLDWGSSTADVEDANHYDLAAAMQPEPVTDGTNGTPRTAPETRPRNIAMLPCIKT